MPLADRIRPTTLDDVAGQKHLLGDGMALRNIIMSGELPNMIFYGPSGIGKTTVAEIIARSTDRKLYRLNATNASTSDIKSIIAELDTLAAVNGVLLYLDEIQYFNKKQQQSLLQYIENGRIVLIASTTENPYFYIYNAILSRSTVFEFRPLSEEDIIPAVERAFRLFGEERGEKIDAGSDVTEYIARTCGGDVRKAINAVELCVLACNINDDGIKHIELESARQLTQKSSMRYDNGGDEHYDLLSAFQKSMRGSDPDAAIYYLARLLEAGDLQSACRRLLVCACEDVGLANPQIIPVVKAAVDSAFQLGLPEARIPLADAVVMVSISPKSNTAYLAVDRAIGDIRSGKVGQVPDYLKDAHYGGASKLGRGLTYKYAHNYPGRWVDQNYLPEGLENSVYYEYGDNKYEQAAKEYWKKIKKTVL